MRQAIGAVVIGLLLVLGIGSTAQAGVIGLDLAAALPTMDPDDEVAVIVTLADKVDLKQFKDKAKVVRRSKLIKALKRKADETQKSLKDFLKQKQAKHTLPFWVFNGIAVTVPAAAIEELASQPGVESVRLDQKLRMPEPASVAAALPEWNLTAVRAPELWDLGYRGAGMVVASMDTGVDAAHPDLASRWRGGSNSWFDLHGEYATPHDAGGPASGHGTQVTGIMVGGDAGAMDRGEDLR